MNEVEFKKAVILAKEAAMAYYNTDTLKLTDSEYDALIEEIRLAKEQDSKLDDEGVLTAVGGGVTISNDIEHSTPMLSLDKANHEEQLNSFLNKVQGNLLVIEPKLDGMAIKAIYKRGKLVLAATRGDGHTGEDVTKNVNSIQGLPKQLSAAPDLEVRGEVYMTNENFEATNKNRVDSGKTAFINPRNAVAGTLRKLESKYISEMSFAAYDSDLAGESYLEDLEKLQALGIQTAHTLIKNTVLESSNGADVASAIANIGKLRTSLNFPIDGAVIKVDKKSTRAVIGHSSHAPLWAIAFKYPADTAITKLLGIEMSIGRTGRVGLRAVLEPVFLAGATISYATLHNPDFVTKADFRVGDYVYLYRAGDVIPKVTAPDLNKRQKGLLPWIAPDHCPECKEPLIKDSLLWRCATPACSLVEKIKYFASRDAMDIEGLDDAIAEALINTNLVSDFPDIYRLTELQLATLVLGNSASGKERQVGKLVAHKIYNNIQKSKTQPLHRVVTALGIRGTGRSMSRRLVSSFSSLDQLRTANVVALAAVEGIGEIKAKLIYDELQGMSKTLDQLAELGITTGATLTVSPITNNPLVGKKIVVTGSIPGFTRTGIQEAVEKLGGIASSSVSKNTDLVIVGADAGSKAQKAADLGVKTMSAAQFNEIYREVTAASQSFGL